MSWIIGILTFILVLNSLLLILLILVQLPKKEAGLGTAFGSSTTDALFGAGTGNVLTKLTKYCAIIFFVITLSLSVMNAHHSRTKNSGLQEALKAVRAEEQQEAPAAVPPVAPESAAAPLTNALMTGTNLSVTNPVVPVTAPPAAPTEVPEPPTDAPSDAPVPEQPVEAAPPQPR